MAAAILSGLREDLSKFIPSAVAQDVERVIEDHETQISEALGVAEKLVTSQTAQVALRLLNIPGGSSMDAFLAEVLAELDNEIGKLAPAPAEPAPAAPAAPADPAIPVAPTGL